MKPTIWAALVAAGLMAAPLGATAQDTTAQDTTGGALTTPSNQAVGQGAFGEQGTGGDLVDMQLRILNEFGGLGFSQMRNFRKVGENYMAEVMMPDGTWMTVTLDPMGGITTAPMS